MSVTFVVRLQEGGKRHPTVSFSEYVMDLTTSLENYGSGTFYPDGDQVYRLTSL